MKIDYSLRNNDKLMFRYYYNDVPQVGQASNVGSTWLDSYPTRFQNWTLGEDHLFSPTLINTFRFTYVRSAFGVIALSPFSLTGLGLPISLANINTGYGLTAEAVLNMSGYVSPTLARRRATLLRRIMSPIPYRGLKVGTA